MTPTHDTKPVQRMTTATPRQVWDVLADGWHLAGWVVGASRIRAVEAGYPAKGTSVHHSVGSWPAVIDDSTSVLESEPTSRLVLLARIRPFGKARVELTLEEVPGGTLISMSEDFVEGPAASAPGGARRGLLRVRNEEALHRLALLAERATSPDQD